MAIEFKLPDIGEGIAEGEIVKWLVKEGDTVAEHQAIVEVMTDKATVEVPAPAAGTITKILATEGDTVPVGSVIFHLDKGADGAQAAPQQRQQPAAQQPAAKQPAAQKPAAQQPAAKQSAAQKPAAQQPAAQKPAAQQQAPARPAAARAEQPERPAAPKAAQPAAQSARAASGGGKTIEFKLPDIGEGIAEGEIVKWLVGEGTAVAEHQAIVEVMTDKATVEVPAPAAGTVTKLLAAEGQTVPVGSVIFHLQTAGAGAATGAEPVREPAREHATVGAGASTARSGSGNDRAAAPRAANDKVLAVPSARRVARELGIDLGLVEGTGRNGVVRRSDVEAFAQSGTATREAKAPAASTAPARPAGERETRTPFRGVRRKISEAMVRSAFTAAHFTVVEEVDVTELVRLRAAAKTLGEEQGVKVTYMPFIMKATALALARHPMLNGRLDEEAQELVWFNYVDLGIAMDTGQGLIVPVVRDVQAKGVLQLGAELAELAERTRAGKVKAEELKGSTFSITNAGNIGGIHATPIINFPDIAILGVHRLMKKPGVVETPQGDKIEVRQYMNFSISVDHRLADGADGARFLVYLKRLLENPGLLAL